MDNTITKLLGESTLPQELVETLQDAFDKRVAEARTEAEESIRAEMARRFEQDKNTLVEAMDLMLTDVATKHAAQIAEEAEKLTKARTAFREAKKDMQSAYKARLNEQLGVSRKFVNEAVRKEVLALKEAKKALVAERLKVAEALNEQRSALVSDYGRRVQKIEEFITRHVKMELDELAQDQKALVEARVKLVSEGKQKLRETQDRFIREAAKKVDRFVTESLATEIGQLHEDLERNRQNMFGRRIFEAVAAEFMTSYLAEGTEIGKRDKVIESLKAEVATTTRKLNETASAAEQAARKARIAEARAQRTAVLSELLSNLRGEKRAVMENLMETVKTENLRETFNKLLPSVLSESGRKAPTVASAPRQTLSERAKVVTGDRSNNRLFETATLDSAVVDEERENILRLAGVTRSAG
jgi:hypothetical protein